MAVISWIVLLMIVQTSSQQGTYSYRRPLEANPSPVCVGGSVTIRCEIDFTNENDSFPTTANFRRFANNTPITSTTVNHQLLRNGPNVVGVVVSNITPDDNNIIYTCTNDAAPENFSTLIMLEVTEIPTVSHLDASDNCKNVSTSWMIINGDCQNAHYSVTLITANNVTLEGPVVIKNNSYDFTQNVSTSNEVFSVVINAVNGLEIGGSRIFHVPPPVINDTIPDVVLNNETCVSKATVQWNLTDDTLKCGNIQYTYTLISESKIIKNGMVSSTSLNFSNLAENTSYTFTLNGANRAENKTLCNVTVLTLSMDEAIPEIRIISNKTTSRMINISWETDSPIGCGMVQYEVMISTVEYPYMMGPDDVPEPTALFSDLNSSTTYNITIFAVNDAMEGIMNVTLKTKGGDGDDSSSTGAIVGGVVGGLAAVMVIIIVVVIIYIVYKKKSKVQQGPSKIKLEDTEKTPSPVDEPVAYATAETDKVKLGTGGITYADIDIGKGPAAPGSIFPQDRPTYGQVKPSN